MLALKKITELKTKKFEINKEDYLSYKNTKCLKGIFAVLILLHHLYQYSKINTIWCVKFFLNSIGELAVAMFFFFSGYGLMTSYVKKGKDYVDGMVKNKIEPFYLTYIIMSNIYILLYSFIGREISAELILKTLTFGQTIIEFGWYLQTILIFYLMFYIIFKFCKSTIIKSIFLATGWISYCMICVILRLPTTWYVSSLAFLLGIWWSYNNEKIYKLLTDKKIIFINSTIALILFFILFVFGIKPILPTNLRVISKTISNVIFVILAMHICYFYGNSRIIYNNITEKLGNISYEIYVSQGIFLILFRSGKIYIDNTYVYIIVTFISTILFANILHPIFSKINKIMKEKSNAKIKINDNYRN